MLLDNILGNGMSKFIAKVRFKYGPLCENVKIIKLKKKPPS